MSKVIYSVLVAFLISILIGPMLISLLHKLKFGQSIREDGPKSHQKKAGTPTMGGIIFILATILSMLFVIKNPNGETVIAVYALIAFAAIGSIDDMLKIIHKKNEGLKSYQKMILLLIVSGILAYFASQNKNIGTAIIIPFINQTFDLGKWYIPFIIFFFFCSSFIFFHF